MSKTMVSSVRDFNYHDRQYRLFISYNQEHAEPFQPLYFLDANSQAEMMLENNNETDGASILYIGIGYPDGVDILAAREKDYTIQAGGEEYAGSGGAEAFYHFIADIVKPYIESTYNVDTSKQTLAGHSYGGQFTLYVVFNHLEAFQNYVAGSPAICYGADAVTPQEELLPGSHVNLLSRIIGNYEENVSAYTHEAEAGRMTPNDSKPAFQTRNLRVRLIDNEQRCNSVFCPGGRHGGLAEDYAKQANRIAGQKPQREGYK